MTISNLNIIEKGGIKISRKVKINLASKSSIRRGVRKIENQVKKDVNKQIKKIK